MNGTDYAGSNSNTVLNTGDDAIVMSSNDDINLDADKMIDLYSGMYLKTEDTSGNTLKMSLWKTCTMAVPDVVADDSGSSEDDEVVVVDLDESEIDEETDSTSSTNDDEEIPYDSDMEKSGVESSASAPGFELVFGVLGLFCVVLIRRS
jgi:hypothetical protein